MSSGILTRFSVKGLFGKRDLDIQFENDVLLIVAENGSGKTTILRILYYFLSKQWVRLLDFDFDAIVADIGGEKIRFKRSEYLERTSQSLDVPGLTTTYPVYKRFFEQDLREIDLLDLIRNPLKAAQIEAEYDIPMSLLVKIVDDLTKAIFSSIKADWETTVIYLPTFRRIEREFSDVFEDLDKRIEVKIKALLSGQITVANQEENIQDHSISSRLELSQIFSEVWQRRGMENWKKKEAENYHMELVEFGMSDIKYDWRSYIRNHLQDGDGAKELDSRIESFLNLCNKYLIATRLVFEEGSLFARSELQGVLELDQLSSGEKQIISIFSHLCLSKSPPIIIIDEPELSLSISWQESIIGDIFGAGVTQLIAATHSPFIVSDDFRNTAHGINEYVAK